MLIQTHYLAGPPQVNASNDNEYDDESHHKLRPAVCHDVSLALTQSVLLQGLLTALPPDQALKILKRKWERHFDTQVGHACTLAHSQAPQLVCILLMYPQQF